VVRKTPGSVFLSSTWFWSYLANVEAASALPVGSSPSTVNYFRDQGSLAAHTRDWCSQVVNLPYNMHLGREPRELSQGQGIVTGSPVGVHGCKKTESEACPLYTSCCMRRPECVGNHTHKLITSEENIERRKRARGKLGDKQL